MKVSVVGLGSEGFEEKPFETAMELVDAADACGINFCDMYNSNPRTRESLGLALAGRRKRFLIQGHLGSAWKDGQYYRTRDIAVCREMYRDLLTRLKTDYIDVGMIHFVD